MANTLIDLCLCTATAAGDWCDVCSVDGDVQFTHTAVWQSLTSAETGSWDGLSTQSWAAARWWELLQTHDGWFMATMTVVLALSYLECTSV